MKSKNLFDYASRELSQDAFLCWLISNKDTPEVEDCAYDVLNHIFNITEAGYTADDISDIDAKTQVSHMDIVIDYIAKGINRVLVIEDKTSSSEHNQLKEYDRVIREKWPTRDNAIKIFYKLDHIYEGELKRIDEAEGWKIFEFETIYAIFSKYRKSPNLILRDYSNHVCSIYEKLNSTLLPLYSDDQFKWLGFFRNYLEKEINRDCSYCSFITRYSYTAFNFYPKAKEKTAFIEIRSRDIVNGEFNAKILTYGADNYMNKYGVDRFKSIVNKYSDNKFIVPEKNPKKQYSHSETYILRQKKNC